MTALSSTTVSFRAFGSAIQLLAVGVAEVDVKEAFCRTRELAERWELLFSRFRPESELSRVNQCAGQRTSVSEEFLTMLLLAHDAWQRTDGRFDPTILPALEAAGYDRDFRSLSGEIASSGGSPMRAPGMAAVEIDAEEATVRLPHGARLDFGGIAKGAFVDRVALSLMHWSGGCVSAGGDLRVWGVTEDGEPWVVGVEDPREVESDIALVQIDDARACAVATSGSNERRWQTSQGLAHHLIDPATGSPAVSPVMSCSVLASTAVEAEVAAKSLFLSAARGERLLLRDGALAVLVGETGDITLVQGTAHDACTFIPAEPDRQSA